MTTLSRREVLNELLDHMDDAQQDLVIDYAKRFTRPRGIPGWKAVQIAREINFPPEDLAEMAKAIEEEFSHIEEEREIDLDRVFDEERSAND